MLYFLFSVSVIVVPKERFIEDANHFALEGVVAHSRWTLSRAFDFPVGDPCDLGGCSYTTVPVVCTADMTDYLDLGCIDFCWNDIGHRLRDFVASCVL
jgi:hypothetical protein